MPLAHKCGSEPRNHFFSGVFRSRAREMPITTLRWFIGQLGRREVRRQLVGFSLKTMRIAQALRCCHLSEALITDSRKKSRYINNSKANQVEFVCCL